MTSSKPYGGVCNCSIIAYLMLAILTMLQYPKFFYSPSGVFIYASHPGSLNITYSLITID